MENKELSLAQKFESTFRYYNEVLERIKKVTKLIQNSLSNNPDFKKAYPNGKCKAVFLEIDQGQKKVIFRLILQENIKEGESFYDFLGKLSLNAENIENDKELIREINSWFDDFLKKKQNA